MRLTSMSIKNFKGIDERGVRIDFAPITMLFGPNNAGKSTIIQAMHLAREVLCRNNADTDTVEGGGSGISLGSFKDYVHKHEEHREVSFRFDMAVDVFPCYWNVYEQELYENTVSETQDLLYNVKKVSVELGITDGALSSYTIYINDNKFSRLEINDIYYKFTGCTVAHILDEDIQEEIQKETQKAWDATEAKPDDYGNEVLDAEENILQHFPQLLQPFVKKDSFDCFGFPGIQDEDHSYFPQIVGAPDGSICMFFEEGKHLEFDDAALFRRETWLTTEEQADEGSDLVAALAVVRPLLLASLILGPGKLLRDELNRLMYIGPLRQVPPREFTPCKYSKLDRWADGLAAWDIIATATDKQRDKINAWLHGPGSLETGYTLQTYTYAKLDVNSPEAKVLIDLMTSGDLDDNKVPLLRWFLRGDNQCTERFLRNEATGVAVQPRDMGTGISQVMPVVVAGALVTPDSIIAIEQPELHIHPRLQVALGDLFIKAVTGHDRPPLFLLETHSEHLLLRLLRRIRQHHEQTGSLEVALTPEQLAVFWIGQEEGRVVTQRLGLDEDGSFNTPWPEGFFDERGEELFG